MFTKTPSKNISLQALEEAKLKELETEKEWQVINHSDGGGVVPKEKIQMKPGLDK